MSLRNVFVRLLFFVCMLGSTLCVRAQMDPRNVTLHWQISDEYNATDSLDLILTIKNMGSDVFDLGDFDLWFTSIYPIIAQQDKLYTITDNGGNLFCVRFNGDLVIQPRDSISLRYTSQFPIFNTSIIPNGFYFQDREVPSLFFPVELDGSPIVVTADAQNTFWAELYDKNETRQSSSRQKLILPTPASLDLKKGELVLSGDVSYQIDEAFDEFGKDIVEFASLFEGLSFTPSRDSPKLSIIAAKSYPREAYGLVIDENGIKIKASTTTGVFYALQTLRSVLETDMLSANEVAFPFLTIEDAPRFTYRGLMIDIARNFQSKNTIIKYLDIMSRYKLNTFHFHFSDDEGWRIAMPSLPELTEIGANRTPLFAEQSGIQPVYGSGGYATSGDFLSRADFVEILKYAKNHHITIVPEIETPGHGRAAIKAMEVRYQRYLAQGDTVEAKKYLLNDFADTSVYTSAQYWHDNVMNPALPSVYTFLATVIDDFKAMYSDAGLELKKISLGGDEVPTGVWEGSPQVRALMDRTGMTSVNEVWPYYVQQIHKICAQRGIVQAGWEEIGMVNKGAGMDVNGEFTTVAMQLDVWNNLIGGGNEDLAYRLANAGYNTVFISASNNYFDMAWNSNFVEPGLKWATYADIYQSYLFMPENFFANIDLTVKGAKFEKSYFKDKVRLNEKGRAHLIGIKGGLWAETVVDEKRLDYMVFPRFFSLAERAWSPRKDYENDGPFDREAFNKDYSELINTIGQKELPKIASKVKFRLPAVGVRERNGELYANTEYPGFAIHYTVDGSMPSRTSPVYREGIRVEKGHSYSFATITDDGRSGTVSTIQK
ncbi:MAG: family 20 glycosylhydrolase [Sphingobacterium sp.]